MSTRVLVNTGSTLIQAVSDKEGGSGLVRDGTVLLCTGFRLAVANEITTREAQTLHKFQHFVKWLQIQKTATGNKISNRK